MSTQLDGAATIARVSLHDPEHFDIQRTQTLHRLALLKQWDIAPGSKILELGCGQGDCTTALASAAGESGTVVAVDPAGLDYGAPYTLGQAQSHISQVIRLDFNVYISSSNQLHERRKSQYVVVPISREALSLPRRAYRGQRRLMRNTSCCRGLQI
ncbi:Methyltransferase ustM [Colletotrichum orbiculare MAFF 240422]|uniref:Methyltransferase ustM n=1 Tax=Colletotrichum orbiculare (strain 104-T / ATCC 96160 / CBS 514.97 / LARS 414 / MAFF 240422) TaxID=1213857 RepID=A0A484FIJ0_COLOR|nr:Methyltransferase ustM [Colletotrichum orbiculare MAFF 240422]